MSSYYFDPHVTHWFEVEIDGQSVAHFTEVNGLSGQVDVFEIKEGGLNSYIHRFATRTKWGDITCKRGFINDTTFWDWVESSSTDSLTPRYNGSIIMIDDGGNEACRWNFFRAFPLKYEGPSFNAKTSAIAIESLTLAIEWLELKLPGERPEPPPPPPPPPPPTPKPENNDVNFAFDDSTTDHPKHPETGGTLDQWEAYLKENPDQHVFIDGHTDSVGSYEYNLGLSKDRANVCYQQMLGRGIPPSQMTKRGHSWAHLKVEPGPSGANRRTEINDTDLYGCSHTG